MNNSINRLIAGFWIIS